MAVHHGKDVYGLGTGQTGFNRTAGGTVLVARTTTFNRPKILKLERFKLSELRIRMRFYNYKTLTRIRISSKKQGRKKGFEGFQGIFKVNNRRISVFSLKIYLSLNNIIV